MKTAKAKSTDCSHIQKILVKSKTWGGHLYSIQRVEATLVRAEKENSRQASCKSWQLLRKDGAWKNRVWRSAVSGLMAGRRALEKEKLPSVRENVLRLEKEKASSEKQADL